MTTTATFAVDTLVQATAELDDGLATGVRAGHEHLSARCPGAVGTVQSVDECAAGLVYFVQHEEYGDFAAYLAHELRPAVAAPRLPRLEEGGEGRGLFINIHLPTGDELPCALCAEVLFPDGMRWGVDDGTTSRAVVGHELCSDDLTLVRAIVGHLRHVSATPAQMHGLYPKEPDTARLCLAMEYLGARDVLQSPQRLDLLPAPGARAAFRMARAWDLVEGARGLHDGAACRSAWTWGATWLRLRCVTCEVTLQHSRGCNVAGFQYATLYAWSAWAQHMLLGMDRRDIGARRTR